jgi:hypothetical protein
MRANGVRKLPYDRGYTPGRELAMADFKVRCRPPDDERETNRVSIATASADAPNERAYKPASHQIHRQRGSIMEWALMIFLVTNAPSGNMARVGKPTFGEMLGHFGTLAECEAKGVEYVVKNSMFRFECQHSP